MNGIINIITRELRLVRRSGYEAFMPLIYLVIILISFNIAVGYISTNIIKTIIPLMIWLSCLLVCVMNIESMFKEDYDDGSLEMSITSESNQLDFILGKILAHWIITSLPIVIFSPGLAILLGVSHGATSVLLTSLFIGTLAMSFIGGVIGGLTVSLKRSKILVSIISLPLYIPILIFGTSAVNNYNANLGYDTELILLTLILLIFLIISPYLCLKSLKISLD